MTSEKFKYFFVIICYLLTINFFSPDNFIFQEIHIIKYIYNSFFLNFLLLFSLLLLKIFLFEVKLIKNNMHLIYITAASYFFYFLIFELQNPNINYYFLNFIFLLDILVFSELYFTKQFKNKYTKHILYIFSLSAFINPNFFYLILFLTTISVLLKIDVLDEDVGKLKYLPVVFILIKPISFFNGYLNNLWISSVPNWYRTPTRYLDSYDLFKHIYCNNKNECDFKNDAIPFLEYFTTDIKPELLTEIYANILIFIISFLILKYIKKNGLTLIQLIVLLSPVLNFAIQRMNLDNLVLIAICLLVFKNKFVKFFGLLILFLTSILKLYPLIILFVLLIYEKSKMKSLYIFIFFSFSLILVYDFFKKTSGSNILTSGLNNTFGIISDFSSIDNFFGSPFVYFLIFTFSITLFIKVRVKFNQDENVSSEFFVNMSLSLFVLLGLFSNWDYRLVLFLPLFFIKGINRYSKIFLFYFITFSATGYLEPIYNSLNYFNIIYLISSIVSIIAFNIFLFYAIEKQFITYKKLLSQTHS